MSSKNNTDQTNPTATSILDKKDNMVATHCVATNDKNSVAAIVNSNTTVVAMNHTTTVSKKNASSPDSCSSSSSIIIINRSSTDDDDDDNAEWMTSMQEPFRSTLSYINEQRLRLDDTTDEDSHTTTTSSSHRFRCDHPLVVLDDDTNTTARIRTNREGDDDDDAVDNNNMGDDNLALATDIATTRSGSRSSMGQSSRPSRVDLARRFLDDDEHAVMDPEPKRGGRGGFDNDDLMGYITTTTSPSNTTNLMWDHHSERGLAMAPDQSLNLMDLGGDEASYYYNNRRSSTSSTPMTQQIQASATTSTNPLNALKQKIPFLSSSSGRNRGSFAAIPTREQQGDVESNHKSKNNNDHGPSNNNCYDHRRYGDDDNNSKEGLFSDRIKLVVLVAVFILVTSVYITLSSTSSHHGLLQKQLSYSSDSADATTTEDDDDSREFSSLSGCVAGPIALEEEQSTDNSHTVFAAATATNISLSEEARTKPFVAVETKSTSNNYENEKTKSLQGQEDDGPATEDSRFHAMKCILVTMGISDPYDLEHDQSPAYQALQWIADEDPAILVIPGFDIAETGGPHDYARFMTQLLQRYALTVLYREMKLHETAEDDMMTAKENDISVQEKDNWTAFDTKWANDDGEHVCYWPGVECDEEDQVSALNLTQSLLKGSIPKEIIEGKALPFLSVLDLSHNQIRGPLPIDYNTPFNNALKELHLDYNHITGRVEYLSVLRNLAVVDLTHNLISGYISESLTELTNLETLLLAHNQIRGSISTTIGGLTKLTNLFLDDNHLMGSVPTELGNIRSLEQLRLFRNRLTGTVPAEICKLRPIANYFSLAADCKTGHIECSCCTKCF